MGTTRVRRALAAPLVLGAAALLALTGCSDDDPAPAGGQAAAGDVAADVEVAADEQTTDGQSADEQSTDDLPLSPDASGDEATCLSVLTYGAVLPLYLLDDGSVTPDDIVEALDGIAAQASAYDPETPEVHDAAVDVQSAAEEAADAVDGGADPADALEPVVDALDPLADACVAAGVPLE